MIEEVKKQVYNLLNNEKSGHGMDHINRVLNLALKFAKEEKADITIVSLIALLHDVDDYKLFGEKNAENLPNAKKIMSNAKINNAIQNIVLDELKCIGYSKRLSGISPKTIEGKIVSDADMCDALGALAILRTREYGIKNNRLFFDKNIFPVEDINSESYKKGSKTDVCHFFEKLLRLKALMLTKSGKEEAKLRHQFLIDFLYQFFKEENATDWIKYLDEFLNKIG